MSLASRYRRVVEKVMRSLRRRLFYVVKGISFRAMRALNSDFDTTTTHVDPVRAVPPHEGRMLAATIGLGRGIDRPVVINGDRITMNEEVVGFFLRGVFRDTESATIALAEFSQGLIGRTFEEAPAVLDGMVRNVNGRLSAPVAFKIQASFYEHQELTARNREAYLPSRKLFPNAVFWPNPTDPTNPRSLFDELPLARRTPILDRTSRLVSAGSCFAMEIAHALQRRGYNYLVKEPNQGSAYEVLGATEYAMASAAWGIIFNTPSFRQLVEKVFCIRSLPKILWTQEIQGRRRFLDPFRENVAFDSPEAFEANYQEHIQAARAAFCEADVLIVTLGLNEVWYFKADGSVFSRNPWKTAPALVGHRTLSVEENVDDLIRMTDILRSYNPDVQIIVSLSPVPLHATFQASGTHVVEANSHSKAVLRVAAQEFVKRRRGVHYFPSYELVTVSTEQPWSADQRHVNEATVASVMNLFHTMYDSEEISAVG